ncbi:MAG: TIGR04076 family protein [bacterium]|nr:TIGR04076 family protein [bacterium]
MSGKITGVKLKVISQKGSCGSGHKEGDETLITEMGVDGKICIHALYSVMPKVFAFLYEAEFPWLDNPDISTHACPDAYNPVVFQVERIREE